jgi:hypothetical protein
MLSAGRLLRRGGRVARCSGLLDGTIDFAYMLIVGCLGMAIAITFGLL